MIAVVVVSCLFLIAGPFVFYPLLLWLRATWSPLPIAAIDSEAPPGPGESWPRVDLVICAHDESESIGARIENALALDYPRDKLRISIASDGSTDGTVEIARGFEAFGVQVLDLPRAGKAAALAAAVRATQAEIIAFSDANSEWRTEALTELVRPLADPRVGGVAGDQRYRNSGPSPSQREASGERAYWSFDRQLKRWQTRAGNVISATGAIYAIRRSLFDFPPPDATDDFMISTGVIARGARLVFAPEAVAFEPPASKPAGEFRRKVRIITRGLRAVGYRRALLRPSRTGLYALELGVHKLWRRLTWIPLLGLVLISPFAWRAGGMSSLVAAGCLASVGLGAAGLALPFLRRFRVVSIASYVVMVQAACAVASWNILRGHRVSTWETERSTETLRRAAP